MPRARSELTFKKVEFAKGLIGKNDGITLREIAEKVSGKFGTGLDLRIISNVKNGKDPFEKPGGKKRKRSKKDTGTMSAGTTKRKQTRRNNSMNPFSDMPAFIVAVPSESITHPADGKREARAEVGRLLEAGHPPDDIIVYGRQSMSVEVKHRVNL